MASQTTNQVQSWSDNIYISSLLRVLMLFGLVFLVRSARQLVGYIRNGARNDDEPGRRPNIEGSDDVELGGLDGQEEDDIDLDVGLEAAQGISLPQRAHGPQEHGHRQRAADTANIGGSPNVELGGLDGQEVDNVDFDFGLEATGGISLPQRVYRPQERGHGQRAGTEGHALTLGGNHV